LNGPLTDHSNSEVATMLHVDHRQPDLPCSHNIWQVWLPVD